MTWQTGLLLIVVIGWYAAHPWLVRRGYRRLVGLLIGAELASFTALWLYLAKLGEKHPSVAMATGLAWFAGLFGLVVPAVIGAINLWKYRRAGVTNSKGID